MAYDQVSRVWYPITPTVPYFSVTDNDMRNIIRLYLLSVTGEIHTQLKVGNSLQHTAKQLISRPELVYSLYQTLRRN